LMKSELYFMAKLSDQLVKQLAERLQELGITVSIKKANLAQDLSARLTIQLQDYDPDILHGDEFLEHLRALQEILGDLKMSARNAQVAKGTALLIRSDLMEMLPKMLEDPEFADSLEWEIFDAEPSKLQVPAHVTPNHKFFYRLQNRPEIAEEAEGLPLSWHIRNDLKRDIEQKLGGAFQVTLHPEAFDEQNGGLIVSVVDVMLDNLITGRVGANSTEWPGFNDWCPLPPAEAPVQFLGNEWHCLVKFKGDDFELSYRKLFAEMEYMRLQGVDLIEMATDIGIDVWQMALDFIAKELPKWLRDDLKADVLALDENNFKIVLEAQIGGRCCSTTKHGEGQMFYVARDMLGGAGAVGYGYLGFAGHCPTINLEHSCKERGGVKTHFRSITSCYQLEGGLVKQVVPDVKEWCDESVPLAVAAGQLQSDEDS